MNDPATAREAMADLLGLLGHPDRLHILEILAEGPENVASLAKKLGCSQPRASQHLALMKSHHLVSAHREGRKHIYTLSAPMLLPWLGMGLSLLGRPQQEGRQMAASISALRERLSRLGG